MSCFKKLNDSETNNTFQGDSGKVRNIVIILSESRYGDSGAKGMLPQIFFSSYGTKWSNLHACILFIVLSTHNTPNSPNDAENPNLDDGSNIP